MTKKQKPLPSVEESLRVVTASLANVSRNLDSVSRRIDKMELARERDAAADAKWKADRAAADAKWKADRAAADAKWKADRAAERKRDAAADAKWKADRAAERKRDAAADAKRKADHDKAMAECEEMLKNTARQWGWFTNTEGGILEDEVYANLNESKQIGDIPLVDVEPNLHGARAQYDMLGINGKLAVLIEVKRTLSVDDVKEFVGKGMKNFVLDFPNRARDKTLVGAIIYQSLRNDEAAKAALKAGLILLRAEGKKGLRQIKTVAAARRPKTKPAARAKKR